MATSILTDPIAVEKPRLLLVDDDHLILESLGFVLQESFDVLTAGTREEAKSLLQQVVDQPALALVDLGLPPRHTALPRRRFHTDHRIAGFQSGNENSRTFGTE